MRVDGRTDMTKFTGAFRDLANAPETCKWTAALPIAST